MERFVSEGPLTSRCNWLFSSTREALGAGASVREIVLQPEPLLHQVKHVATLQLRVLLRDGFLQLGEEALPAEAKLSLACRSRQITKIRPKRRYGKPL